jgi:hypothetical protein
MYKIINLRNKKKGKINMLEHTDDSIENLENKTDLERRKIIKQLAWCKKELHIAQRRHDHVEVGELVCYEHHLEELLHQYWLDEFRRYDPSELEHFKDYKFWDDEIKQYKNDLRKYINHG